MDIGEIHKVIINLHDPTNKDKRILFTSRSKKFLTLLFEAKRVDAIDLHYILLRVAHASGWFSQNEKYINLKDIVTYFLISTPPCLLMKHIKDTANQFTIEYDNQNHEVEDMKRILAGV